MIDRVLSLFVDVNLIGAVLSGIRPGGWIALIILMGTGLYKIVQWLYEAILKHKDMQIQTLSGVVTSKEEYIKELKGSFAE